MTTAILEQPKTVAHTSARLIDAIVGIIGEDFRQFYIDGDLTLCEDDIITMEFEKDINDEQAVALRKLMEAEPVRGSIVDRLPEVPSTPSSDDNPTPALTELQVKQETAALLEKCTASMDAAVTSAELILGGTSLATYCLVGESCYSALHARKAYIDHDSTVRKTKSQWRSLDVDNYCADYALKVRREFPGLVRPIKESSQIAAKKAGKKADSQVRVIDWISTAVAVRTIEPILKSAGCDGFGDVSYSMVNEFITPMTSFSKSDLDCEVRKDWFEFLRTVLVRLIRTEIEPGEFLAEIDAHKAKLADDKKHEKTAGKTPAQIAAEKKEEETKKANTAAKKLRADCNTGLTTSLSDAMSGLLSDDEVKAIVTTVEKTIGRKVVSGASVAFNPDAFDLDQFKAGMKSLLIRQEFDAIKTVCEHAKRIMVSVNLVDDSAEVTPVIANVA